MKHNQTNNKTCVDSGHQRKCIPYFPFILFPLFFSEADNINRQYSTDTETQRDLKKETYERIPMNGWKWIWCMFRYSLHKNRMSLSAFHSFGRKLRFRFASSFSCHKYISFQYFTNSPSFPLKQWPETSFQSLTKCNSWCETRHQKHGHQSTVYWFKTQMRDRVWWSQR